MLRAPVRAGIRTLIRTRLGLRFVNVVHGRLSARARQRFFYLCCDTRWRTSGEWAVDFAGRRLRLPLSHDFPDAWPAAIGFHGYDPEMHALYETLVCGPRPPRVVFDVGASYGLHALRFLVHGARVVAFEPNPECHRWFATWCAANDVPCELVPMAVGDGSDMVVLAFPEGRTYLGSVVPRVRADWDPTAVRTLTVAQVSLDDVVRALGVVPDLVKIDTEGAEIAVLRGAVDLLRVAHPTLVFEAWHVVDARRELWSILDTHGYAIATVDRRVPLTHEAFITAQATNFVAEVPPGRVIHSARQ